MQAFLYALAFFLAIISDLMMLCWFCVTCFNLLYKYPLCENLISMKGENTFHGDCTVLEWML